MKPGINIGLIGAGRIGKLHGEHLAHRIPGANLVAICDIITEAADELAARLRVPASYKDYRRIMDDDDIEAIATVDPLPIPLGFCVQHDKFNGCSLSKGRTGKHNTGKGDKRSSPHDMSPSK